MMRLLFIDDDPQAQKTLKMVLAEHYSIIAAYTGQQGLDRLRETAPDVILLDINLPDVDGLKVLERIVALPAAPPVIMLTAYGDIQFVKQAIQIGAYDYLVKPYDLAALEGTLRRALQNLETRPAPGGREDQLGLLIGESPAVQAVKKLLRRYGPADSPVLIRGESGTGKELAARALHRLSLRQAAPFIPLNCAAIPESLLESELFGSERGAYTDARSRPGCFEQANGGTLFLDEIGEMAPSAQAKLLRVLEAKELYRLGGSAPIPINIRVLSATNKNLRRELETGRFREDLYYRISVLPVSLPALRERREDIPLLIGHFLAQMTGGKRMRTEAVQRLLAHSWPGNVRELKNVLERASLLAGDGEIRVCHIEFN